ncbi:MAG: Spy/CpxP family protein refolding chaperone [Nostoc sp. S4]|nr:Spy/CpxP family protein refolding chaperone [Nostoc sp. S4]
MVLNRVAIGAAMIITLGGSAIALTKPTLSHQVIAQIPTNSPPGHRTRSGGWIKDLNLTPQQIQQIKQIRTQSKQQMTQKRQAVRQAQQELHDLIAGTASTQQVRDKYNQIKVIKQQLADAQFENTLAIREILNPAQRQKFADRMYKKPAPNQPPKQN